MKYTILLLMSATPAWLKLNREQRAVFFEQKIAPIIQKFSKELDVRLFDSEFFHAAVSDYMMVETDNLDAYADFIEYLRDTEIYSVPYFELKDIITGVENRFKTFDAKQKNENNG
jgi:folate-dependent tRNA-U54 methylase TrmFO/GidA